MARMEMTWDEVKRRMKNGASVKTIAELNGVAEQTVYNFIKKNKEADAGIEDFPPADPKVKQAEPLDSRTIDNKRLNELWQKCEAEKKVLLAQQKNCEAHQKKIQKKIRKLDREYEATEALYDDISARLVAIAEICDYADDFVHGTIHIHVNEEDT